MIGLRTVPIWFGVYLCGTASMSYAQSSDTMQARVGERVRVTEPGAVQPLLLRGPRQVTGTLVARTDTGLTVDRAGGAPLTVPLRRVATLEVSRGRVTAVAGAAYGAKRGAVWGLLAAPLALLISRTSMNSAAGAWLAAATVGSGASLGVVYYGGIQPPERWERVPVPSNAESPRPR